MALSAAPHPWLAVVNPAAGGGRAPAPGRASRPRSRRRASAADSVATRGPGDASELVGRAYARGVRRFLALGGDGTLHEIVNGLGEGGERTALAVAAHGTGNDWRAGSGCRATRRHSPRC